MKKIYATFIREFATKINNNICTRYATKEKCIEELYKKIEKYMCRERKMTKYDIDKALEYFKYCMKRGDDDWIFDDYMSCEVITVEIPN